jgi:superoxide oxidase
MLRCVFVRSSTGVVSGGRLSDVFSHMKYGHSKCFSSLMWNRNQVKISTKPLLSRFNSVNTAKVAETYAKPLIWFHWIGAAGMTGLVISGWAAGTIPNDPQKTPKDLLEFRGKLMHLHESVGLLMLACMFPRVAVRLASRIPPKLPGPAWEQFAGKASHMLLYFSLIFMPISGLGFGYASGWGVPFFAWKVPGAPPEKAESPTYKAIEKFFYENHHRVGQMMEYLLPIHVGAVIFHHLYRGHNMLRRMNPFAKSLPN